MQRGDQMKKQTPKLLALFVIFSVLMVPVIIAYSQAENNVYLPMVYDCANPIYPVFNGDFELGEAGWVIDEFGMAEVIHGIASYMPHGGYLMGYLEDAIWGGYIPSLSQSVTVPEGHPYLAFWWAADTVCDPTSGDRCGTSLLVTVNDLPFDSVKGQLIQPWHESKVDLRDYQGQTVTLGFVNTAMRDTTRIVLDDISFQSCP